MNDFKKKQWKIKICTRIRNNKNTKGNFKTRNTLKCATVITYVCWLIMHRMVTSFAITLYDQCYRRHVVGQRIFNDINLVRIDVEVFVDVF